MPDDKDQLASQLLMVGEEPYCIVGWDLKKRNTDFLEGFDTGYFEFLINTFVESEDDKRAAIALRSTLHHSLETLFTLLCALAQAPACVYAWIARCSTPQLRGLVQAINRGDQVYGPWVTKPRGWSGLANIVFDRYMPNTDKAEATKKLFASLWGRLAHELLDDDNQDEYNSIKHGLRMRSGGFTLRVGREHSYGVPPLESEFSTIGHSEHGSSFFRLERVEGQDSRTYTTRRVSLNWRLERVILLCQLTAISVENVVGALRFLNGAPANTVKFVRPPDDSDFDRPWGYSPGVTRTDVDFHYPPGTVPVLTKVELLREMQNLGRTNEPSNKQ